MMPPPSFRPGSKKPAFGGKPMMADGGFGSPEPIGGPMPGLPPGPPAPPPDQEPDTGMDSPTIKPEAVNYHDDPHSCSACQYMSEDSQCAILKMAVSPDGGCTAFEAKGGADEEQGEISPDDESAESAPMSQQ